MNDSSVPASPGTLRGFKSKWVAGLLGLLGGALGLHRWYLQQPLWWVYPLCVFPLMGYALRQDPWFREPAFFIASLFVVAACLETIIIGLTPAQKWDARFNAAVAQKTAGGTIAVVLAIVALMGGTILLMTILSLAVEGIFMARGS